MGLVNTAENAGMPQVPQTAGTNIVTPAIGAMSELSPESQEAYDAAMEYVAEILYSSDDMNENILDILRGAGDAGAEDAILTVTTLLISDLDKQFEGVMPEEIYIPLAEEIAGLVTELGETANAFNVPDGKEEAIMAKIVKALADQYGPPDQDDYNAIAGDVSQDDVSRVQSMVNAGGAPTGA